ncbi:MAG: DUF5107 domain-containing protein [Acidobacteria bacterium]|nr:DUF5107 domain-containing protein [Acidobacteriota bacterium]MBI3278328.1 DUF5107 domain-containing protein [Acidobacteriota bacterium]
MKHRKLPVSYVEYEFALKKNPAGVPVLDWELFESRPPRIVKRSQEAVTLENELFRATLLPARGLIYSFFYKPTQHEQLWINRAAMPIRARNDTGYWVTWGGIEHTLPRGEHGASHALPWSSQVVKATPEEAAVRMFVTEPLTGLEQEIACTARLGRRSLEVEITIRNQTGRDVRFSHWTNNMFAPGGEEQLGPDTEFIVPADRLVPADRPFNSWMKGMAGPADSSPLRFAKAWMDMGDLMSTPLREPWFAALSHETREAVVRIIDPARTPGFNIWTWGFPPSISRQRAFTARPPNLGYVEMWNGTTLDYSEAALSVIRAGEIISWREKLCAIGGIKSATDLRRQLPRCLE